MQTTPQDCGYLAVNTPIHGGIFTAGKIPGACTVEVRDSSNPVQSATVTLYIQPGSTVVPPLVVTPEQIAVDSGQSIGLRVTGGQPPLNVVGFVPKDCGSLDHRWYFTAGSIPGNCRIAIEDSGAQSQRVYVNIHVRLPGT